MAEEVADAAAKVTSRYFRTPLSVESKSDESPVTAADRGAEEAMRAVLKERVPTHGVYGEELSLIHI